jgi:hypothetical protein
MRTKTISNITMAKIDLSSRKSLKGCSTVFIKVAEDQAKDDGRDPSKDVATLPTKWAVDVVQFKTDFHNNVAITFHSALDSR